MATIAGLNVRDRKAAVSNAYQRTQYIVDVDYSRLHLHYYRLVNARTDYIILHDRKYIIETQ